MKLTSETKFFLGTIAVTIVLIIAALWMFSRPTKPLPRETLAPERISMRGPKDAKHYLVEYSDFQCPACRVFSIEVEKIAQTYKDNLLIVYRHYPLPQHENARPAAFVAQAAGNQGKFWEMGALLFENQEVLSEEKYASFAAQLGLDIAQFTFDRTDKSVMDVITEDQAYGDAIGLRATPTFFFDGIKLELAAPDDLRKQVEEKMK